MGRPVRLNCQFVCPGRDCEYARTSLPSTNRWEGEDSLSDSCARILPACLNPLPFARGEASKDHNASLKKHDRFQY
jgi:hypothetical protein